MIQKSVTLTLLLLCGAGALTLDPPSISTGAINCISKEQLKALGIYIQGTATEYNTFKDTAVAQALAILETAKTATTTFQNQEIAAKLAAEVEAGMASLMALSDGATTGINELAAAALSQIKSVADNAPCTLEDPGFNFADAFNYSGLAQLNICDFCAPLTLTDVTIKLGNQCPCDCGEL